MRLIGFAIYLGIGAMLHAVFNGSQFDWSSVWTFGWLFGWPIMILLTFGSALLGLAVLIGIIVSLYLGLQSFAEWRERRKRQRAREVKP